MKSDTIEISPECARGIIPTLKAQIDDLDKQIYRKQIEQDRLKQIAMEVKEEMESLNNGNGH